jgi:chromosome partitioning protein
MKIVSFLGRKGGVSKSTSAHAVAHGLTMDGVPAAYVITDDRELLSDDKRVYSIINGKTVPQLERAIATARQHTGSGVMVIDGGGNRGAVDELLASISDVIVLPFTADDDSVYVVASDMVRFQAAHALPSNWPTNFKAKSVDAGYIAKLNAHFPARILAAAPATHSIRDLMLSDFNGVLLPAAQRFCRTLSRQIGELLEAAEVRPPAPKAKVAGRRR